MDRRNGSGSHKALRVLKWLIFILGMVCHHRASPTATFSDAAELPDEGRLDPQQYFPPEYQLFPREPHTYQDGRESQPSVTSLFPKSGYGNPYGNENPSDHQSPRKSSSRVDTRVRYPSTFSSSSCCLDDSLLNMRHSFPVSGTQLFPPIKCPANKTADIMCAAASQVYGKLHTEFFPTHHGNATQVSKSQSGKFFMAPYDAPLALVESGCCFNVYANVRNGDHLDTGCSNPVLGDTQTQLFSTVAIYTPGSFSHNLPIVDLQTRAIVGGDWESVTTASINTDAIVSGPYPTRPLIVGGNVVRATGADITVVSDYTEGSISLLGGTDEDMRIMPGYETADSDSVELLKFTIESQVCALSKSIQQYERTATVRFTGRPEGPVTVMINCDNGVTSCVVVLPNEVLYDGGMWNFVFDTADATVIKINLHGIVKRGTIGTFTPADLMIPVVWNHFEAEVIQYEVPDPFFGSILAPVAKKVSLLNAAGFVHTRGGIYMGHRDSHVLTDVTTWSEAAVTCPTSGATLTLCDCLCQQECTGYLNQDDESSTGRTQ